MPTAAQRLGGALRRAPYAWLVASLAALFLMLSPLSLLAEEPDEANTALAIGAIALIGYGVLSALVLAPRFIHPRAQAQGQGQDEVALLRWAFALAPFLIGFGAVAAGAQQWSLAAGLVSSIVLLVVAARTIRRSSTA